MKDSQLIKNSKKMLPGSGLSWHKFKNPDYRILQTFINPAKDESEVTFITDELTSLCPLTGFPDQYILKITYRPKYYCIESKSAKFYFGAFRDYKGFIEKVAEKIYSDWLSACKPEYLKIDLTMNSRGGVAINVIRETR